MSPTRPEINAKSFAFWYVFRTSRRYRRFGVMSLNYEAPFVKNFTFFIFGFFPMSQYSERGEAREARERFGARQLCGNRLSTICQLYFPNIHVFRCISNEIQNLAHVPWLTLKILCGGKTATAHCDDASCFGLLGRNELSTQLPEHTILCPRCFVNRRPSA